jgi:HEAT repeat protein
MAFNFSWPAHLNAAFFVMRAIFASLGGIAVLVSFILIRRLRRRLYFRRHDALAFKIRQHWQQILTGELSAESWRDDPMQRDIVQSIALLQLDAAGSNDRPGLQNFLRETRLLDACIARARRGRGWQRRQALATLGSMRMPETIPTLAGALDDHDFETRIAAVRGLGHTHLCQAAEPILERLMRSGLKVSPHPVSNALVHCCGEHPEVLLPYLRRAHGENRELLARVAGEIANPQMADEIVVLAGDQLPEVRASAARALVVAPLPLALPTIADLACDTVWFVRLRAITALDEIRHPRAIPILLEALRDPNRLVRLRSAAALTQFVRDRRQILESIVELHDRYALHAMISALELGGDFSDVIEELSDPQRHDDAAARLLEALREGAAGIWSAKASAPGLEKVHS